MPGVDLVCGRRFSVGWFETGDPPGDVETHPPLDGFETGGAPKEKGSSSTLRREI